MSSEGFKIGDLVAGHFSNEVGLVLGIEEGNSQDKRFVSLLLLYNNEIVWSYSRHWEKLIFLKNC